MGAAAFVALLVSTCAAGAAGAAQPRPSDPDFGVVRSVPLSGGRRAEVSANGRIRVVDLAGHVSRVTYLPETDARGARNGDVPSDTDIALALGPAAGPPEVAGEVVVSLRPGTSFTADALDIPVARLGQRPNVTNDARLDALLGKLKLDRIERLFGTVAAGFRQVSDGAGDSAIDLSHAYRLHVVGAPVATAVAQLRAEPGVAYAAPNYRVAPAIAAGHSLPDDVRAAAGAMARSRTPFDTARLPDNFAVSRSGQSLLDSSGVNAVAAYDEIVTRFGELPGHGEIITDVSLGDVIANSDPFVGGDPCNSFRSENTTVVIGGQRYLDWTSMPLIPTYVADASGHLSGSAHTCNQDSLLQEVGLDFSVMAPLPHARQRAGRVGAGYSDLLGIAPGAQYRLVVPSATTLSYTAIDAALLAAAAQQPHPSVITVSLGFGFDLQGFPARYLEDDPLTEAVINAIVAQSNIVVCVSAGDGLRVFTNAAVAPSGGSARTDIVPRGKAPTDLTDLSLSTAPSLDFDSGSISAGGATLDDIYSAPPDNPQSGALGRALAFPATRWNGATDYASGFGSRVDLSAPSDNIVALYGGAGSGATENVDGTSAAAPEIAAAAAIALQLGKRTGHPFATPANVRAKLIATASALPDVPESDTSNRVGPRLNVGHLVESLLQPAQAGSPGVPRIAVAQRQIIPLHSYLASFNGAFATGTDAAHIDFRCPCIKKAYDLGLNALSPITLAPDWENLPAGARYRLFPAANPAHVIARTAYTRVLPGELLRAAGLPERNSHPVTIPLTYEASTGGHVIASRAISLGFDTMPETTRAAPAPLVPAVVTGSSFNAAYDLTHVRDVAHPALIVSDAGRTNPQTGYLFHSLYEVPLTNLNGTVTIPTSKLHGSGIYGVFILPEGHFSVEGPSCYFTACSNYAFVRVAADNAARTERPAAPLLATGTQPGSHNLEIPWDGAFTVTWDVSNVRGATGAALEISAPGPNSYNLWNPFNNPSGDRRDDDGADSASVFYRALPGVRGTLRLTGEGARLVSAMTHAVRVIPLAGASAAGEASDVSSIAMDGVKPTDGGTLAWPTGAPPWGSVFDLYQSYFGGFAIDTIGSDGFLTSSQTTSASNLVSSLETFDQTTNASTGTPATTGGLPIASYSQFTAGNGLGILGLRFGLLEAPCNCGTKYFTLNPVGGGSANQNWSPPTSAPIAQVGTEAGKDDVAILSATYAPQTFTLSNVPKNTFAKPVPLPSTAAGVIFDHIASDLGHGRVVLGGSQGYNTVIGTFDAASGAGSAVTLPSQTNGFEAGLGLDTSSGVAFIGESVHGSPQFPHDIVGVYRAGGSSATLHQTSGYYPGWIANDPVHKLFAVAVSYPGDYYTNNDALSAIDLFEENGKLLKTLEIGNFFDVIDLSSSTTPYDFGLNSYRLLELNPQTRTGYVLGRDGLQIQVFRY